MKFAVVVTVLSIGGLCHQWVSAADGVVGSTPVWQPLFEPLVYTSRNGGSGETTMFRWKDGKLYCVHSSGVSPSDCPNSAAIPTGHSFFHVREVATGRVVSCAAISAGHSFFSAAVD
eukprot:COSAG02_NODE_32082_length_522_cov_1.333333_1_plen_116_part_10